MFNITKQEKSVLLFIGSVVLLGIGVNYLSKNNPHFKNYFTQELQNRAGAHQKINASTSLSINPEQSRRINLNKAALEELTRLSGIGPGLAQRIIDYRLSEGGFKAIEEVKKVKGIGAGKFELLKDHVSIEENSQ